MTVVVSPMCDVWGLLVSSYWKALITNTCIEVYPNTSCLSKANTAYQSDSRFLVVIGWNRVNRLGVSEWLSLTAFWDSGHRVPCSPYKPCNHNLYIGIIIFPRINNTQYKVAINFKKHIKKETQKKWQHPLSWFVIGDGNSASVYNDSKYLTTSLTEMKPHTAITNQP